MLNEHTQVALTKGLPKLGLEPGDVGVMVHVYNNGQAYEVKFLSLDGNTIGVQTLEAHNVRQVSGKAVLHERERFTA